MRRRTGIVAVLLTSLSLVGSTRSRAQGMDSIRTASPGLAKFVPPVPTPESFVADVAHVLSQPAHDSVDAAIRDVQARGLGDIAVAILPSIGEYAPVDVGLAIFRVWRVGRIAKIGDRERDVGVLVLLVPKELSPNRKGQCWITTGRGSQGMLTDATVGSICRTVIVPEMIKRDYEAATLAAIDAIETRMRADPAFADPTASANASADAARDASGDNRALIGETQLPDDSGSNAFVVVGIVFGALGAGGASIAGGRWWRRNHRRRCAKCGKAMERLSETADNAALTKFQSIEADIHSVDYDVWQCACGERIIIGYVQHFSGYQRCTSCHALAEQTSQRVVHAATHHATGRAEQLTRCVACGAERRKWITLPQLVESSSASSYGGGSSFGSDSPSGGSSSSDSSFGGSGSSDGGGGGSSY